MNASFWDRLQTIDRRIIYGILLAFVLLPLFKHIDVPIIPSQQSQDFYDTIEGIAKNPMPSHKLVIISGQWSPSTRGENKWQAQAVIIHLMKRHVPFAILSFDTQNNDQTMQIVNTYAPQYGCVYGRDYINWGYRPLTVFPQMVKALATDLPGAIKTDRSGKPITSFPIMQDIHTIQDVGAVVEITAAATAETWIGLGGLVQPNHTVPLLLATTAVGAPTYYPYLDSGQISGMLTGIKGAGDYEYLLGTATFGTRATGALSLVYALLIGLIILGNVGFYASRAAQRREQE